MVKIRLFRTGKTKRPMYRVVVVDSRRKRQGRVLQTLGTYDPHGGALVTLDDAALELWVGRGAQASDTVRSLIRKRRKAASEAGEAAEEAAPAEPTEPAPAEPTESVPPEPTESAPPAS
jgi:small subunit ribosomal protein S16